MSSPSHDPIFDSFLQLQLTAMEKINAQSEVVRLLAEPRELPRQYLARLFCTTMIRRPGAEPELFNGPTDIGIRFHSAHLRKAPPSGLVFSVLRPAELFHPNVNPNGICTTIRPGAGLNDLVFTLWNMLTFQRAKSAIRTEHPANREASVWCNRHLGNFPTDSRPLLSRHSSPEAATIEFSDVDS